MHLQVSEWIHATPTCMFFPLEWQQISKLRLKFHSKFCPSLLRLSSRFCPTSPGLHFTTWQTQQQPLGVGSSHFNSESVSTRCDRFLWWLHFLWLTNKQTKWRSEKGILPWWNFNCLFFLIKRCLVFFFLPASNPVYPRPRPSNTELLPLLFGCCWVSCFCSLCLAVQPRWPASPAERDDPVPLGVAAVLAAPAPGRRAHGQCVATHTQTH